MTARHSVDKDTIVQFGARLRRCNSFCVIASTLMSAFGTRQRVPLGALASLATVSSLASSTALIAACVIGSRADRNATHRAARSFILHYSRACFQISDFLPSMSTSPTFHPSIHLSLPLHLRVARLSITHSALTHQLRRIIEHRRLCRRETLHVS